MPNNETINAILLLWFILSIAFLLVAAFSTMVLRDVANYCVSRAAGLDSYRKTFAKKRVRKSMSPEASKVYDRVMEAN